MVSQTFSAKSEPCRRTFSCARTRRRSRSIRRLIVDLSLGYIAQEQGAGSAVLHIRRIGRNRAPAQFQVQPEVANDLFREKG